MERKNSMKKKWLTPREVSEIYSLNYGTLANWRCNGIGPPYRKVGGRRMVRYSVEALDRYFETNGV